MGHKQRQKKREELAEIIKTTKLTDGVTEKHYYFGEMTKPDWVHFLLQHTDRHIAQLEELKTAEVVA